MEEKTKIFGHNRFSLSKFEYAFFETTKKNTIEILKILSNFKNKTYVCRLGIADKKLCRDCRT